MRELVKNGVAGEDIGIITPYNSQANIIHNALNPTSVEIHTIDKYQVGLSFLTVHYQFDLIIQTAKF